jgi:hypothetical protein
MTEAVTIALIAATPPTLMGGAALLVALKTKVKVQEVHLSINSRMDQLVKASVAVGAQEERDKHTITVQGVPDERQPK